jgi:non-ribosomal peptide synthase protein (TIGR01720 family)
LPAIKHKTAIEQIAQRLQTSLNLAAGPLLRVALIHLGDNRPGRLLVIVHHTVMDGYTMRFFIEDFQSAYQQLSRGEPLRLPAKTTSYRQVAEWWATKAQSDEMRREEAYWLSFPWQHTPFPVDFPNARGNTDASAAHGVLTSLSTQETRALLQSIPKQYSVQIMDVLLWALTQTLTRWTGGDWAQIKVVDSGQTWIREMSSLDLSRTVGLFASDALVMLKRSESEDPAQGLQSIQEQLQCIPRRGLGYPLLLLNCADPQRLRQLRSVYKGEFKLNYLGSESFSAQTQRFFRFAHESVGPFHNPQDARDVLVHCEGFVLQERLHLHWIYSENFHQRATIAKVAQDFARALRDLIQTLPETLEQLS